MEGAEIAVVHAEHIDIRIQVFELVLAMDFQQDFQLQAMGGLGEYPALFFCKGGGDQQDSVGAYHPGLEELVGIDDEVLAK